MAAQIVAGAPPHLLGPRKVLVPVPLHAARARRRGFNQAERLAGAVARRTGLELRDCLRRRGASTARQVGRGRTERLGGVEGLVAARPGGCPAEAVLVDDVVTTGATLRACAAALKAAGTRSVGALA